MRCAGRISTTPCPSSSGELSPDVRDGLKPVHRRILYGMQEMGLQYNKKYTKSAKVVGHVMGNYHPHGDSAIYDTMVRLAQDFSQRYPHDRRTGKLRLRRRRPARRHALHRVPHDPCRQRDARRHRLRHCRLHPQLRRVDHRAHRPPGPRPQPHRQRVDRDCGRHGDQTFRPTTSPRS